MSDFQWQERAAGDIPPISAAWIACAMRRVVTPHLGLEFQYQFHAESAQDQAGIGPARN